MSSPPAFDDPPVALSRPMAQTLPVAVASPHSGRDYSEAFLAGVAVDMDALQRSEDSWVDELVASAPALGAPLVAARFPRVFVDPNREPFELDPAMFSDPLPSCVNRRSPRVRRGLGAIPRIVADGSPIYRRLLTRAEARRRFAEGYFPYHRALKGVLRDTQALFGHAVLLDCHSMPSQAVAQPDGWPGVDFVLGDRHGAACRTEVAATAEAVLRERGFSVVRNAPYAGGFAARFYGRPERGVQALQIEINRALYMDEARHEKSAGAAQVRRALDRVIGAVGALYAPARAAE